MFIFSRGKKMAAFSASASAGKDDPLNNFLVPFEGKSGVYFISPHYNAQTPEDMVLVKVGMSQHKTDMNGKRYGGLGRRLDSYLLCYPQGFHIYAILQTKATSAFSVEKFFQSYFTSKGKKAQFHHSRIEEWYYLNEDDVRASLAAFMRSEQKGLICKHNIYHPVLFLNTNGRESNRPRNALPAESKEQFERHFSPDKVPQTMKPAKRQKQFTGSPIPQPDI